MPGSVCVAGAEVRARVERLRACPRATGAARRRRGAVRARLRSSTCVKLRRRPGLRRRQPGAGVDVEAAAAQRLPARIVGVAEHDDRRVDELAQALRDRAHRQLRRHEVRAEPVRDAGRGADRERGTERAPTRAAGATNSSDDRERARRGRCRTDRASACGRAGACCTVSGVRARRSIAARSRARCRRRRATSTSRARCSRRRRSRRLNERCSRRARNSDATNRA